MNLNINKPYVLATLQELLETHSPIGFCHSVMEKIKSHALACGYHFESTQKGCGIITIPGESQEKVIGLSAHVDTLGAMVRSIKADGTIRFTPLGGPILATLDGEYCTIRTRKGQEYSGTFLSTSPSIHVFEDSKTVARDEQHMEVRIDERVTNKEEVLALGISPGDFIFIDPKTTFMDNGFIKSRFLDDKASVGALLGLMEMLSREKIVPLFTTKLFISVYEEVGHGSAYIPEDITEFISVDMGCIGSDLTGTEFDVSICAKDSSGPYDYQMVSKLVHLAQEQNLSYAVDIYPMYGSDASAAQTAGNNIRTALIGPGVAASHGMERTHYEAIENTFKLAYLYITN